MKTAGPSGLLEKKLNHLTGNVGRSVGSCIRGFMALRSSGRRWMQGLCRRAVVTGSVERINARLWLVGVFDATHARAQHRAPGLARGRADVRRAEERRHVEQRIAVGRLDMQHVEGRPGNMAAFEALLERVLVDDA